MSKVIKVSDNFWKILDQGHKNINKALNKSLGNKKITFIDYSDMIANTLKDDLENANRNVLLPIPRGRTRVKLKKPVFKF